MTMTKTDARRVMKGDYIPKGRRVDIRTLRFRRTEEDEVFRCCRQTGRDPQSGPLYCGDLAEWIAFCLEEETVVALCERHPPPKECRR